MNVGPHTVAVDQQLSLPSDALGESCRRYLRLYVTRPRSGTVRASVSLPTTKKRSRQLSPPCRLLLLPTSPPRRRLSVSRRRPPTSDRLVATCWSVPSHHQAVFLAVCLPSSSRVLRTRSGPVHSCLPTSCAPLARRHSALPLLIPVSHSFSFRLGTVCHMVCLSFMFLVCLYLIALLFIYVAL